MRLHAPGPAARPGGQVGVEVEAAQAAQGHRGAEQGGVQEEDPGGARRPLGWTGELVKIV